MSIDKLIFVYNANSGTINSLLDSAHKIVSPSTYQCRLCDLTYDAFKENAEWARFRESLANEKFMPRSTRYESEPIKSNVQELAFLHKDEFEKQYKSKWLPKYDFPAILMTSNHGLELFMSAIEMNGITSTTELIEEIKTRLK